MRRLVRGALLAAMLAASPLAAQTTIGWDVSGLSAYDWRGLRFSNRFVVQPHVYLSHPVGVLAVTLGGWGNFEAGKYDHANHISENGAEGAGFTEFQPYAEVSGISGLATIIGGVTGYFYPNDQGISSEHNTWEAYGILGLALPLSPELELAYDFDAIDGAYLEGRVSHSLQLSQAFALDLGGAVGLSAGQGSDGGNASNWNFEDEGFTHVDLMASSTFSLGQLWLTPEFHFTINQDELTRFTSPTTRKDTKVWFGVTLSWEKTLGVQDDE